MKKYPLILLFTLIFIFTGLSEEPYFVIRINNASEFTNFLLNSQNSKTFLKSKGFELLSTSRIFLKLKNRIKKYSQFTGIKFGKDFLKNISGNNAYIFGFDISDTIFLFVSDTESFKKTPLFRKIVEKFPYEDINGIKIYSIKNGKKYFGVAYYKGHLFLSNSSSKLKKMVIDFDKFNPLKYHFSEKDENLIYEVYLNLKKIKRTSAYKKYYRFKMDRYVNFKKGKISLLKKGNIFVEKRIFFNDKFDDVKNVSPTFLTEDKIFIIKEENGKISDILRSKIFESGKYPEKITFSLSEKTSKFTSIRGGNFKILNKKSSETLFKYGIEKVEELLENKVKRAFYISKIKDIGWFNYKSGILILLNGEIKENQLKEISKYLANSYESLYLSGKPIIEDGKNYFKISYPESPETLFLIKTSQNSILISKFQLEDEEIKKILALKNIDGKFFEVNLSAINKFFKKYTEFLTTDENEIFYYVIPSLLKVSKDIERIEIRKFFKENEEVIYAFYKITS